MRTGLNILLITTDQERFPLGFPDEVPLPNRQRLTADGITFNNYYVTTAPCTPSRSVMYTGQHTAYTRMFDNTNFPYIKDLSPEIPTLGHMLREVGYYTAYKGKWHLSHIQAEATRDALEPYGFSDYNEHGDPHGGVRHGLNHDPTTAADAADWLLNRAPEIAESQPWFLAVNFVNPHDIMFFDSDVSEEDIQQAGIFEILGAPQDPLYTEQWRVQLPRSFYADDLSTKPAGQRDFDRLNEFAYGKMPKNQLDMWRSHVNYYINCVRDSDRHIGTVLDALETSGQAENTVIIFTSDHGEMGGAHGLRQKGPLVYCENLNVPFVVCHPELAGGNGLRGRTTDAVASSVDLAPTILALGGLDEASRKELFPRLVGYDVSGSLVDPDGPGERAERAGGLLMTYDAISTVDPDWSFQVSQKLLGDVSKDGENKRGRRRPVRTVRKLIEIGRPDFGKRSLLRGVFDGRYKFARYFAPNNYHRPEDLETLQANNDLELYDTASDPEEINNLARRDNPDYDADLILKMNDKLNTLIEAEIGEDEPFLRLPKPRDLVERVTDQFGSWQQSVLAIRNKR
jgi:arylsulfatase A-like enzyme